MKKVIKFGMIAFIMASMTIVSCRKGDRFSPPIGIKPMAHLVKWNGTSLNCKSALKGPCFSSAQPADNKLESILLEQEEAAGTITSAEQNANRVLTTITLTRLNLSTGFQKTLLSTKKLTNEGEVIIPIELMNESFKAAGIKEMMTEPLIIPRGDMPLTLNSASMTTINSIEVAITLDRRSYNYIGHVTLLR